MNNGCWWFRLRSDSENVGKSIIFIEFDLEMTFDLLTLVPIIIILVLLIVDKKW